jgi:hypothetical protein
VHSSRSDATQEGKQVPKAIEDGASLGGSASWKTSPLFAKVSLDFEVTELMRWQKWRRRDGGLCLLTSFESDNAFQTGKFSSI